MNRPTICTANIKQYIKDENHELQAIETLRGRIYSIYDIQLIRPRLVGLDLIERRPLPRN